MAMSMGKPGKEPEVMIDINTTPLIDVMLVLLVMLIITIPIQLHSVNLNMPVGNPPPPLVEPEVLRVDIDPSSRIASDATRRFQDRVFRAVVPTADGPTVAAARQRPDGTLLMACTSEEGIARLRFV